MARLIGWSVPALNLFRHPEPWPYSLGELDLMDEGTLGKELYVFLGSRGLGYLPKYEEHDAYHALLGYGTTVTEELKLQAFMWGNGNSTFAGKILFLLGYLVFPSKTPALKAEILRGRGAKPLSKVKVADLLPENLTALRRGLCIKR